MLQAQPVQELIQLIRDYDPALLEHSLAVANLALQLASLLGVEGYAASNTLLPAALLHDVGKTVIDKAILYKAGPLSPAEWALVRHHPSRGARMLAVRELDGQLQEIVLYHHERWDGKGYLRLAGNSIPPLARLVTLADALQAMSTGRPYRQALSPLAVYAEVRRSAGGQFDPQLLARLDRRGFWPPAASEETALAGLLARERRWLNQLLETFGSLQYPLVQAQSRTMDRLVTAYYRESRRR